MKTKPGHPEAMDLFQSGDPELAELFALADEDGEGDVATSIRSCTSPVGYVANSNDCNDSDININTNTAEVCDGIDNNCDGQQDEGVENTYYLDADTDGTTGSSAVAQRGVLADEVRPLLSSAD